MKLDPHLKKDLRWIQRTHILKTLSQHLFQSVIVPQWLDVNTNQAVQPIAQSLQNDCTLTQFIQKQDRLTFAKLAIIVHQSLAASKLKDLAVDYDACTKLAAKLYRLAQSKAETLFNQDAKLAADCCWSDRSKRIIPMLASQTRIVNRATQQLLLTNTQRFRLAASLAIAAQVSEVTSVDADFILQLNAPLIYKQDLEIVCLNVNKKGRLLLPKPRQERQVYLALQWNEQQQWFVLYGYCYSPTETAVSLHKLLPISDLNAALETSNKKARSAAIEAEGDLDETIDLLDELLNDEENDDFDFSN